MNKYLNFITALLTIALTVSCTNAPKKNEHSSNLVSTIDALSQQASACLRSKTKASNSCISFAKMCESGGCKAVKQYSIDSAKHLEKDLDGSLDTIEQILIISKAVFYLSEPTSKAN